jgi:hypothetical protein
MAVAMRRVGEFGMVAIFSFSGCLLECAEPDPLVGVLFHGAAHLVLAAIWGFGMVAGSL